MARKANVASRADAALDLDGAVRRAFAAQRLHALLGLAPDALPLTLLHRAARDPAAEFVRRPGKRFRTRLVELGWHLAVGEAPLPPALAEAIELIHAGSMIVDDIEDGSTHRRGTPALHRVHGVPLALNAGTLLYFLPLALLDELALPSERAVAVHRHVAQMMVQAHCGQALDLDAAVATVPQREVAGVAMAVSTLKTGSLMGLAAALGPLCSGADAAVTEALARFGGDIGIAFQMCDDAGNLTARDPHKQYEDLRLGRITWVWAWLAEQLEPGEYGVLQHRAAAVHAGRGDAAALAHDLRRRLGDGGRERAVARRRDAFARLRDALGDDAALRRFERDCAGLERRYA